MAVIGICEDDPRIRSVLAEALTLAGHDYRMAHDAREALALFGPGVALDALILDIGLPDADGRDLCQALRGNGQPAPVLFLTALDALHDRLAGFSAGADDYLVKPFAIKELLARLEVLVRRARHEAPTIGDVVLDPSRHALLRGGREVSLSPTEFRLLAALVSRDGDVVRRATLIAAAWPDGAMVSDNTLDSYVRRVRVKLEEVGSSAVIRTARGIGYRYLADGGE
ncbi:response regulator transcription factor [Nocardioides fonticola]|uniref:Response regulator transcription factor n=1 Tax=Nocardioides fonticola TaxID=450363 RepID=A0ABP7XA39_9ACTN